jgi:hypothetical protein
MLLEPILVSFLYEYAYGKLIRTGYSDFNRTKTSRDAYMYGFLFSLLNSYIQNPLMGMFGIKVGY